LTRWGAALVLALAVSPSAWPAQAGTSFKTVSEMAHECVADDRFLRGSCSGYVLGSIDTLESARRGRGEDPCLAGHASKDEVAKEFIRAILASYADIGDLPAAALIEDVYKQKCGSPN